MNRVLAAEGAILVHLELVGRIFLVLHGVVVPLLALAASEGDLDTRTCFRHFSAPPCNIYASFMRVLPPCMV